MSNVFVISDLHLGHANTTNGTFKNADGINLRPFKDVDEMNEQIISRWNNIVRPDDKVYVLGDVVINKKYLPLVSRLMGHKRLIRGNHDIFKTKDYIQYFPEIYGVRVLKDMILSHIPLHPDCITTRFHINISGHLHSNVINNPRYLNVAVEQTDYRPLEYGEVLDRVKQNEVMFKHSGKVINFSGQKNNSNSDV